MGPLEIRVRATTAAGKFRCGAFALTDRWKPVDVRRPDVRAQLLTSVGLHVAIHPADVERLEHVELELAGGRLRPKGERQPDPLETAQARIAELEAENARLKAKREGQRKSAA